MPKKRNEEIPLPAGWAMARDFDGKIYFIDHNSQQTSWIDPRDRLAQNFDDFFIQLHRLFSPSETSLTVEATWINYEPSKSIT